MKRVTKLLSLVLSVLLMTQLMLFPTVGEQALDISDPSGVISAGQIQPDTSPTCTASNPAET